MYQNTKHIIKAISITLVVYGVMKLLLGSQSIWWGITSIFYSSNVTFFSILYIIGIPAFKAKKMGMDCINYCISIYFYNELRWNYQFCYCQLFLQEYTFAYNS